MENKDTQVRVSHKAHRLLKAYCKIRSKTFKAKYPIKAAIEHLVETHPEIAPKTDDKEV